MSIENKIILKCVIVGSSGCGKTCLLSKYMDGYYSDNQKSTTGIDIKTKELTIENKNYKLQFWDAAGNDKYAAIMKAYYKSAGVVFFMYDCTRQDSFNALGKYVEETDKYINTPFIRVLISNKNDSHPSLIKISPNKGNKFANDHDMVFLDLSVQNDTNMPEKINTAIKYSIEMLSELKQTQDSSPSIDKMNKLKTIKKMYYGDDNNEDDNNECEVEHYTLSESKITDLKQRLYNINSLATEDPRKLSDTQISEIMQTIETVGQLTEGDYNDIISADESLVKQLENFVSVSKIISDRMNELMNAYDDDDITTEKITEDELNEICELKCNGLLNNLHKNDPEYTVPTECAICNDKFDTKYLHRTLPCKHSFHASCIDQWILKSHNVCPICRTEIKKINNSRADKL